MGKAKISGSKMKKTLLIIVIMALFLGIAYQGAAYIPKAEQILQNTVKLNRHLNSLQTRLKTTIFDDQYDGGRIEVSEQVYMKKGGSFRSERNFPYGENIIIQNGREAIATVRHEGDIEKRRIETVFPIVYFQESVEDLLDDLNFLGVDTNVVTFDRIDKTVTFVIGNKDEGMPGSQLWIDKKNGAPLRFVGTSTSGGKRIILRAEYMDYTRVEKRFWLPTRIEYYRNNELWTVCIVEEITVNKKMSQNLFRISRRINPFPPLIAFLNVKEYLTCSSE